MDEEYIPLIPANNEKQNHDVEPLLRDLFQELLESSKYPLKMANNVTKYNLICEEVQRCGENVLEIVQTSEVKAKDILTVEELIMTKQCKYLVSNLKMQSASNIEHTKLRRKVLFSSVNKKEAAKYGILQSSDLLFNDLITTLDFKVNDNKHSCVECPNSELDFFPVKGTEMMRSVEIPVSNEFAKSVTTMELIPDDSVVFTDYKINVTYKKIYKVRNTTNKLQSYSICALPQAKNFTVQLELPKTGKVSSGLHASFIITFRADNYFDVEDNFTINMEGGRFQKIIRLSSYRRTPNLFIFILKNPIQKNYINNGFDLSRCAALNNCLDCGSCYVGTTKQVYLMLKNTGGHGYFFFMSEEDWYNRDIRTLNTDLELSQANFCINPAYFELNENDFTIISISFKAKTIGLNLESIYMLCNNISFEVLDLIADANEFNRNCIYLNSKEFLNVNCLYDILVPLHHSQCSIKMGENFSVCSLLKTSLVTQYHTISAESESHKTDSDSDGTKCTRSDSEFINKYLNKISDAEEENVSPKKNYEEFLLYFPNCMPFETYTKEITIINDSALPITYYWMTDKRDTISYPNIKVLPHKCIKLYSIGYVGPYSSSNVKLTLQPNVTEPGFYYLLTRIYILSIPKSAIKSLKSLNYEDFGNEVDVLLATVLILCQIETVEVEFIPEEVHINTVLTYNQVYEDKIFVKIFNPSGKSLSGYWKSNESILVIEPSCFVIKENDIIEFKLSIHNSSYDDIEEIARFIVGDIYEKELKVEAKVERPILKFKDKEVNLGCLEKGNTYSTKLIICNDNFVTMKWEIRESFAHDEKHNKAVLTFKELDNKNIELEYTVKAEEFIEWSSQLEIYTTYNDKTTLDSTCTIIYSVEYFQAYINSEMNNRPLLIPSDYLFLSTKYSFTIYLHNASNVEVYYRMGKSFGKNSEILQIHVKPKHGVLCAHKKIGLTLELIPLEIDVLEEIYLPFYFDNGNPFLKGKYKAPDPVFLILLCEIQDVAVHITFPPDKFGRVDSIRWPILHKLPEINGENDQSATKISMPNLEISDLDLSIDINQYLHQIYKDNLDEEGFQSTPESTDTSKTDVSCDSLRSCFFDEILVHENVIEFQHVSTNTAIKKIIEIENISPILANISAEVKNFKPVSSRSTRVSKILASLNEKEYDNYKEYVPQDGFFIITEMKPGNIIKGYSKINLEIIVYGNTWGVYTDQLQIFINKYPPLQVTVFVEIMGLPIEFPIGSFNEKGCPLFRFGVIPYKSNYVNRKIYVRNISQIPICVTWHVYIKSKSVDVGQNPFTLIFDTFHPNFESRVSEKDLSGNLMLKFGKFFGHSDTHIFELQPQELDLNKGDTKWINIRFDPKIYAASFEETDVEACLIGFVQLAKQYRYKPYKYFRKAGSEFHSLALKLSLTLELPRVSLDLIEGQLKFVFNATNVINNPNDESERKVIFLKNTSHTKAIISIKCQIPLHVVNIRTNYKEGTDEEDVIAVFAGECLELTLGYTVDLATILEVAKVLYENNYDSIYYDHVDFNTYCYSCTSKFNIKQRGFLQQLYYVNTDIYFPKLEVTDIIDFGNVFIGNTRKDFILVKNYSAFTVHFKLQSNNDMIVYPKQGLLQAAKGHNPSIFYINVIFIPHLNKKYYDEVKLTSNIPCLQYLTIVRGIGSHNEKTFDHDHI